VSVPHFYSLPSDLEMQKSSLASLCVSAALRLQLLFLLATGTQAVEICFPQSSCQSLERQPNAVLAFAVPTSGK
jgi:hypothetical protein